MRVARSGGEIDAIETFRNRDFQGLDALLGSYLATLPMKSRPREAMLAIAAPIRGDEIRMVNIDWRFSMTGLEQALSLDRATALNDFAAQAYALPVLSENDVRCVGSGHQVPLAPKAVLGPGTGLGTAGLVNVDGRWHAVTGEGGHVTMAPSNEREARIIALGREHFGHCSAERLISGAGLAFLYDAVNGGAFSGGAATPPAEVGERILAGEADALDALEVFFQLLGTVASNLALTFGAYGGVYIAGGIVPRYLEQFSESGFRSRFEDKGRYRGILADIRTCVVTADYSALRGLAAYAEARS